MARVIKLTRTWNLGRKLGEGGFGKVYEATDANGERAAVKLVRKLPGADRELLIAAELSGVPKIMPIIDAGETPTEYVIVMPLAERSLDAELAEQGTAIPVDEAVAILADVAEGLVGMHAKGVVSRDIKPLNVLRLAGSWHVSDFGIARYADSSTALYTFKDRGTQAYTAPERWRGERAQKASDVYSFGVLAHEVLAGGLPFRGPDFGEQHLRTTPPTLSNVPPRLASLVVESLDKSLDIRPTAANILSRLRALATPPTPGGAALQAANQAIAAANAEASAKKATAQSVEERRSLAFEGARARFRGIERTLQEALAEGSQVTKSTARTRTTGWSRSLGLATLFVEEVLPAKPGNWGHSTPKFEVFAFSAIGIRMPRSSQGWEGRSHSLWFCDATEEGLFRWYETAFMDSPFAGSSREVNPYALPPAQDAGTALSPAIGGLQVAWPFLPFDQGDEGQFLDRWLTWFGQAAQGRLHRPSSMPDRSDAHNSWRR